MKGLSGIALVIALIAALAALAIPGYNRLQGLDEDVNARWSEVVSQYQRRADLVPNLVETVKGYARHEEAVFTQVTQARAKVGSVTLTPEMLGDEAAMQRFQQAQGELTSALSRLLVVAENYPELKANTNFENLMTQLEGTENRITTARRNYIEGVQAFNTAVRTFPTSLIARLAGLSRRAQFTVENEAGISTAPQVQFN
ncbi:LemA family protein [Comamonadaceae bacterium OH2310_COT-174]|nr:LemA family protein [Comamonadaceae bacterium OH2310_COT-174]